MPEHHDITDVDGVTHVAQQPDDHTLVLPAGTFDVDQVAAVASTAFVRGGIVGPQCDADTPPPWLSGCQVSTPEPGEEVVIGFDASVSGPDAPVVVCRANGQVYIAPIGSEEPINPDRAIDIQLHTSPPPPGGYRDLGHITSDGVSYTPWSDANCNPLADIQVMRDMFLGGEQVITTVHGPVPPEALATYYGHDVLSAIGDVDRVGEYSRDAIRRRRTDRAGQRGHAAQVAATDDVLDQLDAAVAGVCGCGCGCPIDGDSPSAYFATAACQARWARTNTTNPAEVERRPDHSIYSEAYGREDYRAGPVEPRPAGDLHSGHAHIHIGDARHRIGGSDHEPATAAGGRAAAWMSAVLGERATGLLGAWMSAVLEGGMGAVLAAARTDSPEQVMPVNVLAVAVAERRFRARYPYINPAFLSRTLTCERRQCPDVLGAGYRRTCRICDDAVVPLEFEVATGAAPAAHAGQRVLRLNACPACWYLLPGPAYRASLALERSPGGAEALLLRLETGDRTNTAVGHVLMLHELYAAGPAAADTVTAAWRRLEQQLSERQEQRTRVPDAVVAAALAHHAYAVVNPSPRDLFRNVRVT